MAKSWKDGYFLTRVNLIFISEELNLQLAFTYWVMVASNLVHHYATIMKVTRNISVYPLRAK